MAGTIPTSVLSEALVEAIAGRRVKAAVFTTFTFDPGFFEEEVLPLLFDFSFSHVPKLRLIQLENELRSIDHLAVYYDRRALETSGGSASLDFRRIPIERKGYFHPKIALILVENKSEEELWESLLVGVFSANLTRSGWWENVECAQFEEVHAGEQCRFHSDLLDFFGWIRKDEGTDHDHQALEQVRRFVVYRTSDLPYRTINKMLHPRLFYGQQTLPEFLSHELKLPSETYNLEVISPFFDGTEEAGTLVELIEALGPKETRIFLPREDDGTALCSGAYFDAVSELPSAGWSTLPRSVLQRSESGAENEANRFVHAKVYRLWSKSEGKEFLVAGSANLTRAAHGRAASGNLETAFITETDPSSISFRFWLDLLDKETISEFEQTANQEEPEEVWVPPVTVLYDWQTETARYFWESDPPEFFELSSAGVKLGQISPVSQDCWTELSSDIGARLAHALKSTSFVEVIVGGHPAATVLVREEGMAKKPSLLLSLTPEEILRFWSLLSPEQKQRFLEEKAVRFLAEQGLVTVPTDIDDRPDSMFDRFAGIFHAFASLEKRVEEALDQGVEREAVYRLFGNKYDSLPNLIDKVLADDEGDLVNRYLTLLTARQLLRRLDAKNPDFFKKHNRSAQELGEQLKGTERLKAQLALGDASEHEEFLDWYEKNFLWHAETKVAE